MKQSLQKLQKYFALEAERGFDNRAVMGGLERMLEHWEPEARHDDLSEDLIQAVIDRIRDYPRLSAASRQETLEGLLRRIQRTEMISAPPGSAPAQAEYQHIKTKREPKRDKHKHAHQPPPATDLRREKSEPFQEQGGQNRSGRGLTSPKDETEMSPADLVTLENGQIRENDEWIPIEIPVEPAPQPSQARTLPAYNGPPAALGAPITVLSGIGQVYGKTLGDRLGIRTLRDMLYYLPRRYDDYSQLKPINRLNYGEEVTVIGTVQSITTRPFNNGKNQRVEAIISDGSGALRVTWFNPYAARRLHNGAQIALSGKVEQYLGRAIMNNPEYEPLDQQQLSTNRIVPVYPLTAQITQRWLRRQMSQVVSFWAPRVQDPLPPEICQSAGLIGLPIALLQVHFPDSWEDLKAARYRLAFDEIFLLQLGVLSQKRAWQEQTARTFETDEAWLESQVEQLPFPLTGAQQRALQDLRHDLSMGRPMNRLLQGDVGSGKTVIAALGIAMVTRHGSQAALMAPTSILAEQHYKNMLRLLCGEGLSDSPGERVPDQPLQPEQIRLMVGATPEAEKAEIRAGLANGAIRLVIGTHALIEDPVAFADLQLVVVDEQHRFGVEQRAALRAKGSNPHLLVMTATPIPRSLALTVYGDLDLTVMDEMPAGRQPVSTYILPPRERERAYTLIRNQVEQGHQAFIIYPLVEESDKSEAKAAVDEHTRLQAAVFPKLNLGLLHGRMSADEKDEVMKRFRDGEIHVLVSTSVVEVGVDVSNATVMLIEGANRFGLAQLHQFRGRVGRGVEKAYCLLIPDTPDAVENQRLQVMTETNDGFILAERDLEQRGPGQFLGTRQSGFSELQMANLTDVHLIENARRHAQALFEKDPDLVLSEHQPLRVALQQFCSPAKPTGKGDIS